METPQFDKIFGTPFTAPYEAPLNVEAGETLPPSDFA